MTRGGGEGFPADPMSPSHYDDDGYVIQWLRSPIPSNSLAALYGLARDCRERGVLGPDVEIDVTPFDETNTAHPRRTASPQIDEAGGGLVMLVGVQSNQFPRALDIARPFRAAGIPVGIGGFHVSGCLSMLPEIAAGHAGRACDMGISLFAGEAEEGRLDEVLRDAVDGTLKPLYNFMDDLPGIDGAPTPLLPRRALVAPHGAQSSFDAGRGCPFQCSFCTIINVQGRKSRCRSPDDVEQIVRDNAEQGITRFFITDDNFARNKDWEPIFDRLIEMRESEGMNITLIIQVDTLCHQHPELHREGRAGRRASRLHRAGEHQPGQPAGGQEAAEQDHRVPQDAAGLEGRRRLDLCRLHPRLPERHARIDPRATSR